ncbi:MAG: hypothetical protein HC811_01435 [Flammeovirgaceae bacterium]|nr:hypothetical protein [Flammeovirgaceae bacterium]
MRNQPSPESFNQGRIPLSYLLEGEFTSLYKNRIVPKDADQKTFVDKSTPTKIIVVADGDLARNEINSKTGQPQQLGNDPITGYTFANEDLLMNMVAYLIDEEGLIKIRNKELMIRPLDKSKIKDQRLFWQTANLTVPIVLILVFGIARSYWRKKKYGN